jgi:hypothetical protein
MEYIKISLGDYPRYEELLLKRDKIRKEAEQYNAAYLRKFGSYILDIFRLKIECISLKKKITYCQIAVNRGEPFDMDKISRQVEREMTSYKDDLKKLILSHKSVVNATRVTEYDLTRIKKIYKDIAKSIHPDINPKTAGDEELRDLWDQVSVAYKSNDLERLEELRILVLKALKDKGMESEPVAVDNIDEKIGKLEAEIENILNTDPYNYRFLLDDKDAVEEKKKEFEDTLEEYRKYKDDLQKIMMNMIGGQL